MTERMSHEDWKIRHVWLMQNAMTQDDRIAIAVDWERARAREAELEKRVAELEESLAIKDGECRLIHERGMEAIREANKSIADDDSRIRRIVREELRKARIETVVESSPTGELVSVSQPLANATWPDETEATDG